MVTLSVYLDTSGAQDNDDPMVAVGFLATDQQWRRFQRDWDAMLSRHGVPYLHMREFAHSKTPYEEWKDDAPRRAALLGEAASMIGRHIPNPMTLYISPVLYRAVDAEYSLGELFTGA